jgi:hypothetical protein
LPGVSLQKHGSRKAGLKWEEHREYRTGAQLAPDDEGACVRLDNLSRDVEPQAEAAIVADRSGPLEPVEDPVGVFGGDPNSMVRDRSRASL